MWFFKKNRQKQKRKMAKKLLKKSGVKDISEEKIDAFIKQLDNFRVSQNMEEELLRKNESEKTNMDDFSTKSEELKDESDNEQEDSKIEKQQTIDSADDIIKTKKSDLKDDIEDEKTNIEKDDEKPVIEKKSVKDLTNNETDEAENIQTKEPNDDIKEPENLEDEVKYNKSNTIKDNDKSVIKKESVEDLTNNKTDEIEKGSTEAEKVETLEKVVPEKEVTLNDGEIPIQLSNAIVGTNYNDIITKLENVDDINSIIGLKKVGGLVFDFKTKEIKGVPENPGVYLFEVNYTTHHIKKVKLIVNQDPKKLWKNIKSDEKFKPDDFSQIIDEKQLEKTLIAASKRGRSHEHQGTHRDDHFAIDIVDDWYITVVSDGAGSASLSSLGSKIISEISRQVITGVLLDKKHLLSELISDYFQNEELKIKVRNLLYNVLAKSAYESYKALLQVSNEQHANINNFHSTLLITITKKFPFGYFIASFQIGDGMSAIYKKGQKVILLGWPDSGEYAGQTKFITDSKLISSSEELAKRIKFTIVEDFDAIFSMTDGISDPIFGDEKNLKKTQYWDEFYANISKVINSQDNEKNDNLLKWMNFYKEREHDDRTLTIIV